MGNPSVFLSYSHDSQAHKDWVRKLAEDLRSQGVDATLDQWDLRAGADLVAFMEAGIRGADRVLMVCTGTYVRKAEQRKGGAGYEGMIVTSHVARSTDTVKFIPLVRDNPADPLVPDFLGPRLWLDFRDDELYAERLEDLLRELHELPRYRKPPLGRPAFLQDLAKAEAQPAVEPPVLTPARFNATQGLLLRQGDQWQLERRHLFLDGYLEELALGVSLSMVKIPAGTFLMGSPQDEPERLDREGPQHKVTLGSFLMAQTPITQAQWRAVASWQKVERYLKPDPSSLKGPNRPVERVNWFEAMEFCHRLSLRTGKLYGLPSEAQWEYSCRAGSTRPFHFGDTLTPELANYDCNYTYGKGPKGTYREQTTEVASFPANAWGLHDLHGNVWEWCEDHWHNYYHGAPDDGSAWLDPSAREGSRRLLRGGSWSALPRKCRSAYRNHLGPGDASLNVGFRVVCLPQGPSLNN
ncbi:SUMF1/EgtB/PvdO family nonheme iron enzyme [Synechococcus sp. Tobar12-5m-g]|uniref:SUMF1/EgtB/PvdO family nonheme iron enzyme n=1 Tax=unclassified Synechococcus TaxID=2626047 RepID=UPI0020CF39B4|nr:MULTISPECIES: SUMF1/EgtB/PvdO family nonheme iron enzyme [unclassified Synechococcus]MCP9772453.1 SUMF1/EgtB/PvdO family nonheme iron enzyme [Synechococcus sp. Tobar12-5m-g]MCP9874281.1 SUMF1/EgtB/PvdO family nonheme iron enzyme [Synechococcus sp. Cruz CV-v-12]